MAEIRIAYKAVMSRGDDIPLDPSEVELVTRGVQAGQIVRVKQGLINPSYLISIVQDKERIDRFFEDTRHDTAKRSGGMLPLRDIFADQPLRIAGPKT